MFYEVYDDREISISYRASTCLQFGSNSVIVPLKARIEDAEILNIDYIG
jgi:hypothetical protein